MNRKRPELLIPASSLEVLKTAVMFGADAVYIGLPENCAVIAVCRTLPILSVW